MEAKDLRIGNILFTLEDKPTSVTEITGGFAPDSFWCLGYRNGMVKPIPLTEEILTKWCGFQNDGQHGWWCRAIDNDIEVVKHMDMWMIVDEVAGPDRPITYVQYLHQLQNIYFAITGNELTITLP